LASIPRREDIQIIVDDDNSDSGKVEFAQQNLDMVPQCGGLNNINN
jgi:hypothetical protein